MRARGTFHFCGELIIKAFEYSILNSNRFQSNKFKKSMLDAWFAYFVHEKPLYLSSFNFKKSLQKNILARSFFVLSFSKVG